ncbi:hypothetical protein LTR36_003437 [Oleoguttula mirabilis]|uniref:Xylanolytic transcriptional activator regulatory domain-containing protein n=1 Tax=Oleoguttula mirabilis TaxID=1507867 RepID=A0AAV9JJ28_9PEZI|nr:hypothetical protein LTR36_003437 [Oleoguttula mirabilis]
MASIHADSASGSTYAIEYNPLLVERLQGQTDNYSLIFSRLFPGRDIETMVSLPREELINLALTLPGPAASPSSSSERALKAAQPMPRSDGAESLEALEQAPGYHPEFDEAKRHKDRVQGISDDVNGLSLSVDKQSSYVGVSSITAALKVIFKTAPMARPFIAQSHTETALPSRSNSPPLQMRNLDPYYTPPADIGHKLIESYFAHVHVLMPMVDEEQFWHTYLYGERKDTPWLALLNMVLALGSLAGSTCGNEEHITYFQRARKHLDLETFGSGNLLVLQAIGLLSGYYLHWLNRPNEANSLMGATLRMAIALGLHREYEGHPSGVSGTYSKNSGAEVPVEIRRRTWWSLVCLDTWASMTTGRPSLGRLGPGVTCGSPRIPEQMNNAQYLASLRLLPIIHNIAFCKLATKIQDKLAGQSLLNTDDLFSLDAELVKWHEELPPILQAVQRPPRHTLSSTHQGRTKSATPSSASASTRNPFDFSQPPERDNTACPEVLKTPRAIMHWWYQTLRMLMHRPFLLAAALRRTSYANMSAEEKVAVSKVRLIAAQTIEDIHNTCEDELIAGWAAVWLMYQAVMVPLVSLFSYLSSPAAYAQVPSPGTSANEVMSGSDEEADKWRSQIETAMRFFDKMQRYSVAATKSKDVVARLFAASKHVRQYYEASHLQKQLQHTKEQQGNPLREVGEKASLSNVFNTPDVDNGVPFGGNNGVTWGLSPHNDAAMDSFWSDMWDTFPEVSEPQGAPGLVPGLDNFDWLPLGGQNDDMGNQQWSNWNFDEQQQ